MYQNLDKSVACSKALLVIPLILTAAGIFKPVFLSSLCVASLLCLVAVEVRHCVAVSLATTAWADMISALLLFN